jgi:hypothetical protein
VREQLSVVRAGLADDRAWAGRPDR